MRDGTKRQVLVVALAALCLSAGTAVAQVEEAWVVKYDGPQAGGLSSHDYANDLAVRDGYVYVTGYESRFTSYYATVKYDYSGQEIWARRHVTGQSQIAEALAVDAAGNVYVTGWEKVILNGIDVVTIKYNPDGDVLWQRRYASPGGNNQPNDMAIDAAGNIYVAGASWVTAQQDFDMLLLKYDADGNLLWDRTLDNGDGQLDSAYKMAIDPDGNAILAGYTEPNAYLVKYSPTGDLIWGREKQGFSTNDEWREVEIDAEGNIYVVGEISPPGQSNHIWTAKYDPDGNILWEDNYTGTGDESSSSGGIALMPDGGVVISGRSGDVPYDSIVTIRYDPDGTRLWKRIENAGYLVGVGEDVAADPQGRVYTTGYGYNFSYQEDGVTLGYSPDGELLWTRIYANPEPAGTDTPHSMEVDGAGNVFVAAWSWESATGNDFTTIRYSPSSPPTAPTISQTGGSCPGTVTISGTGFAANQEIALAEAANLNGFVKGGALCNGAVFEIGEPFQLPPNFIFTDASGGFSTSIGTTAGFCNLQAIDLNASCQVSNAISTD